MPPISSYPTVEESAQEHDTCDEYLTKGFLTEKEQQQLALDEEAYREYLEEEAKMKRNLVKNQWCAAHNGTITMKDVKDINKQQLIEEYKYICRRLEK
ncbi:hypothetical protein Tco_0121610 [Tanacetum coccineum]|uniref:Uncharacterized protein n=1 Tax=Tanacetum coccineum TaxID=301880 RepID=A0ABQ4X835_9ASTR